jgi:hypothetical protein
MQLLSSALPRLACISSLGFLAACASQSVPYDAPLGKVFTRIDTQNPAVTQIEQYEVQLPTRERLPYRGAFTQAFGTTLPYAPGSGLNYRGMAADGALLFWGIGDRGPNGDSPDAEVAGKRQPSKVFLTPDFVPAFAEIRVMPGKDARVSRVIPLSFDGQPASGLPIAPGGTGATGEIGLSDTLQPLPYNPRGLDTEAIAADRDGNLWISDEYGPFILKVDPQGHVLKRYAPGTGLPEILAARQPNRGMEGLTVAPSGKVYGMIQSTLDVDGKTRNSARFLRLVELDPATGVTRQFAYPLDVEAYPKLGDTKIGDIVAIDDTHFALIDQGKTRAGVMRHIVYVIDISGADDISSRTARDGRALEYATAEELGTLKMLRKQRVLDLHELGWEPEKAEGLALIPGGFAVINDNDFSVETKLSGTKGDKAASYVIEDGRLNPEGRLEFAPNGEATQLWLVRLAQPWQAWFPK